MCAAASPTDIYTYIQLTLGSNRTRVSVEIVALKASSCTPATAHPPPPPPVLKSVGQLSPVGVPSFEYRVRADVSFICRMNLERKEKQQYRVIQCLNSICAATGRNVRSRAVAYPGIFFGGGFNKFS